MFFEIVHLRFGGFLDGNALEGSAPSNALGTPNGDEARHGVKGGETIVARSDGAMAVPFQML